MRYYWDLVKHFFLANSRHGTHSPFVYKLADTIIYRAAQVDGPEVLFPPHFSVRYLVLLQDILGSMEIRELRRIADARPGGAGWTDLNGISVSAVKALVETGVLVVIHEPYRTRETSAQWNALIRNQAVTVSIDLFHFGLLLHREEQRKENFVLRYPYNR